MAFQTPQTGGKGEPFTSLLFTPKTGDGATKTVPDYRTPRAKSPASAFGGMSRFAARDSTPQRRRSLTPASSMARDTPPPPPMDSLLDTTEGGPACWCHGCMLRCPSDHGSALCWLSSLRIAGHAPLPCTQ